MSRASNRQDGAAAADTQPQPAGVDASQEHPLWSVCKLTLSLAVLSGLLWGGSLLILQWRGPMLEGTQALARDVAGRTDDPVVQALVAKLNAREIYTFDELTAAAALIRRAHQEAETSLVIDLLFGLVVGAGALLLLREGARWAMDVGPSDSITSPVGVLDDDGTFVPSPLPRPQLNAISPRALRRLPWFHDLAPLTPLAIALLQRYAAYPAWPAASEGQHGDTTLLDHVLGVRARALALAEQQDVFIPLAELAALAHDLGKLVTWRQQQGNGRGAPAWIRVSPHHARMSAVLIATLPEWRSLPADDREDLTIAIAFHHRPDQIPVTASLRARALLTLLRQADGLATAQEERRESPPAPGPLEPSLLPPSAAAPPAHGSTNTLEARVASALEWLIQVLRINTRPFDGRADPDDGLVMILDRALRLALAPQLHPADCEALKLDPAPAPSPDDAVRRPLRHPATETIAGAFRRLGWLIEERDDAAGIIWETQIGRLRWHDCWLLRLDRMPQELQERWGRSEWKIEVLGPSLSAPMQAGGSLDDNEDPVGTETMNGKEGEQAVASPTDNAQAAILDDGLPGLPGQDLAAGPPDA